MSKLKLLQDCAGLHDVAHLLALKPAHLAYNLYKKADATKYKKFDIPKRCGGSRTICAPIADLKHIQRQLADVLLDCLIELNIKHNRRASHGFITGRSILTNAHQHRGRAYVLNLDLQDFFGSINFGRVRGFFINDKDFALKPAAATVLAQIACFQNSLPQGSPASPVISNLIGNVLDVHLIKLARRNDCVYTRYADDLTFSTNLPTFPEDLALVEGGAWAIGAPLANVIKQSGFAINSAKVRMQYEDSRQTVTGLVVNRKANTAATYRSSLRVMARTLFRTGSFTHDSLIKDAAGNLTKKAEPGTAEQLQGMLAHIKHVDQFNADVRDKKDTGTPGRVRLFKRFFLFSQFFCAPTPVILCEGKTDNTYLLHALRSRAATFPELASVSAAGEIKLLLRIFKYVNRSAGKTLNLSGGQGELSKFIAAYLDEVFKHFKAPGVSQNPVILVVDHDDGGKGPYAAASKEMKKHFDMLKPFEHVAANLYLVPSPLPVGATSSCIEECFQPATLATTLGGKKFNYKSKQINEAKEYGKAYFAEHVVTPNAATIDFSGFDPLLARIKDVVAHYATMPK
ncbi:retron Ec67 family RNA-directed DNA polymerase/endonuclease [Variovorax sp. J22P240]|uniref:retron Ec67 family RNA-directed DNA polymerase/endonuclease n=1 Tax=Variovorax sp. J22P240 TaxID=3053514 RepID=UPI002577645B|nr:retron Ec67 family RNA-directed DNA polymerase/endonuclease [Variovorax sp. J22P240]MDM0002559.1 retron Ec67 family RNA-directed DNA polymerase/endonuclease [Variovorax sp. J22P240]